MLMSQRDIALAGAYADVERDRIDAETARLSIQAQSRNEERSSSRGFWSGLVSTGASLLGGILSDVRAKENIEWIGVRDDGVNMYRYNYIGNNEVFYGAIAQEVQAVRPDAYIEYGDFIGVDYGRLA